MAPLRLNPSLLIFMGLSLAACAGGDKDDETGTGDDGSGDDGGSGDDTGSETVDADGDGFEQSEDCDDTDGSVYPGADESCNGEDDDCDGDIDEEAVDEPSWYADADGDGYIDRGDAVEACEAPDGYLSGDLEDDCDDTDAEVNPGAEEICNEIDDNCDSEVDEGVLGTWWSDEDGDGFAGDAVSVEACEAPEDHYAEQGADCDDDDEAVNPDAEEICFNGKDDDCDGAAPDCAVEGDLSASDAAFTLQGETSSDYDGYFAAGGDINGDGVGDVVSTAPYSDANGFNSGFMHVVFGPLSGTVAGSAADQRINGEDESHYAGWSLRVGDVDGDGFDDVATVATGAGDYGRAYLQYGSATGLSDLSAAEATWDGPDSSHQIGRGLAMGDVSGDGVVELLLVSQDAQRVYAFGGTLSGAVDLEDAQGSIYAPDAANIFARGMDSGDLDGDGIDDVAMTAPWALSYDGLVYVTYGPISGEVSTADGGGRIEGKSGETKNFGYADCSTGGDVNGDGYDDLLFGSYGDGVGGTVRLFLGPVSGTLAHGDYHAMFTAPAASSYTGNDSEIIGDTDGDGMAEILFSSWNATTSDGVVLMYGPVSGTAEAHTASDARFELDTSYAYRGEVHAAGDLNGDGLSEIMWSDTDANSSAGELYMIWGGGF